MNMMNRVLFFALLFAFVTGLGVSIVLFALGSLQMVVAFNSISR